MLDKPLVSFISMISLTTLTMSEHNRWLVAYYHRLITLLLTEHLLQLVDG